MRLKPNIYLKLKITSSSQRIEFFNCVTKFLFGFGDRYYETHACRGNLL